MAPLKFPGMTAREGLDHVYELQSTGLLREIDFKWAYHQEKFGECSHGKYCEFWFTDPKLATFYSLKWQTQTKT